jgi:DNA (cytosine-5)-methyltransferase 1
VLKCKYNKKGAVSIEELRVLSLFSGIGAFEKALSKQNIPYKLINFCEIDKYAIKSYCAIHNVDKNLNLGDISKVDIEKLEDFDLMTWGFCCQDISIAGKQKGLIK